MSKIYYFDYYFEEIGKLFLYSNREKLVRVSFNNQSQNLNNLIREDTNFLHSVKLSIDQYLKGDIKRFDLATDFIKGTEFQKSVWNALAEIPYGTTISYKDFAQLLNKSNGHRAVANANSKNPLPIILPCHRVISSNGGLGGYLGGVDIKEHLLKLESSLGRE